MTLFHEAKGFYCSPLLRPTSGKGELRKTWSWGVDLTARPRLADHVTGDQVAVKDVPGGGDKATAMTDSIQDICMDLQVTLTVGLCGEGGQTDETDERPFTYKRMQ